MAQRAFDEMIGCDSGSALGYLGTTYMHLGKGRLAEALDSLKAGMGARGRPLDIDVMHGRMGFL